MKNAPVTIKVLVAVLVLAFVGFMSVKADRWLQIRSAKAWCEEYAAVMLEYPSDDMDGLKEFDSISKAIGWRPRLFNGAYGMSAFVEGGVAKVYFSSPIGCYSFSSASGWVKTGSRMPTLVASSG